MAVISSVESINQFLPQRICFLELDHSISLRIFSHLDRSDYKSFNVSKLYNNLACYASVAKERDRLQGIIDEVINLFKHFRYLNIQTQINTLVEEDDNCDALRARSVIRKLKDSAVVSTMNIGAFLLQNIEFVDSLKKIHASHPDLFKYLDKEIEAYSSLNLNDLFFSKCKGTLKPQSLKRIEEIIFEVKKSLVDNIPEEIFEALDKKTVTFSVDMQQLSIISHRAKVVLNIVNNDTGEGRLGKIYVLARRLLQKHLYMEAIDLIRYFKGIDSPENYKNSIWSYRAQLVNLICKHLIGNSKDHNKLYRAIEVAHMNTNQLEVKRELVFIAMRFIVRGMHKENKIVCSYLKPCLRKLYMSCN